MMRTGSGCAPPLPPVHGTDDWSVEASISVEWLFSWSYGSRACAPTPAACCRGSPDPSGPSSPRQDCQESMPAASRDPAWPGCWLPPGTSAAGSPRCCVHGPVSSDNGQPRGARAEARRNEAALNRPVPEHSGNPPSVNSVGFAARNGLNVGRVARRESEAAICEVVGRFPLDADVFP